MLDIYLFIAIIYTVGFIINKGFDIIYDHNTYIDHFSSFFLICIWLMVATSSWNIIYSSLFSIGLSGLFSFIFGIYQNKGIKNNEDSKKEEINTVQYNDKIQFHTEVKETNNNVYTETINQWIGLKGVITDYDKENDYYYGTLDDNRTIILKSEGEKLNKGDKFITTKISGVNIICKKIII